jgi:hypothetical protein
MSEPLHDQDLQVDAADDCDRLPTVAQREVDRGVGSVSYLETCDR